MIVDKIEPGEKVWIPKSKMTSTPLGFEESSLGDLKGAIRQYRGPDNLHLREYSDKWELHQDYGDPRTLGGFIVHIFIDAPEVGFALLNAAGAYKKKFNETKSIWAAVGESLKTGILTYVGLRILKEFVEYLIQWTSTNQRTQTQTKW